jgi:hypothetical protein
MATNTAGDVVEINVPVEKGRVAKDSDLSLLRKATDGLSDYYYKILPSSQAPRRITTQSAAAGQFDVTGAMESLGITEEQAPQDGEVWSPEMFGESQFSKPRIPTIPGITIID